MRKKMFKTRRTKMKKRGEKLTALILVVSLVVLSADLSAAVRKGVNITISKTSGEEVSGELITVKRDSLLLLDPETDSDISVNLNVIDVIKVNNKSLMFEMGLGFALLAAAARLSLHSSVEKSGAVTEGATEHQVQEVWLIGVIGGGAGVLAGAVFGIDKTIQIQGESDGDIQSSLEKLSKKARVKGIQ